MQSLETGEFQASLLTALLREDISKAQELAK